MRRVAMSFGQSREAATTEVDDVLLAKAEKETRWQLGEARINGVLRQVQRRKQLGEWVYQYNGITLDPKCVECYLPSEYIDWRDG